MNQKVTVGMLKKFMDSRNISPELLTINLPFSNMSVRRWIQKGDSFQIPEKYQIHISLLIRNSSTEALDTEINSLNIDPHCKNLEEQLSQLGARQGSDIFKKLELKKKNKRVSSSFLKQVLFLKRFALSSENRKIQMIALGALAYFINPFDFIPDQLVAVGYIDDIGIVALTLEKISKKVSNLKK